MANARLHALGDSGVLVQFSTTFTDAANRWAIALAKSLERAPPPGTLEVVPNLVSVLVRFDRKADLAQIEGAIRLAVFGLPDELESGAALHEIAVRFGGDEGPDLPETANALGMDEAGFIAAHNARPLRVLATGFAPGFVYCGVHDQELVMPRRAEVRPLVPAGTILFAAGQTAIAATPIPTGWHLIGRTEFRNFDPNADPPCLLKAGDLVRFSEVAQ